MDKGKKKEWRGKEKTEGNGRNRKKSKGISPDLQCLKLGSPAINH